MTNEATTEKAAVYLVGYSSQAESRVAIVSAESPEQAAYKCKNLEWRTSPREVKWVAVLQNHWTEYLNQRGGGVTAFAVEAAPPPPPPYAVKGGGVW